MRTKFQEAWTKKEKAWTVVRGAFAGGSSFCALRKACRKFRKFMQAAEYRGLEV